MAPYVPLECSGRVEPRRKCNSDSSSFQFSLRATTLVAPLTCCRAGVLPRCAVVLSVHSQSFDATLMRGGSWSTALFLAPCLTHESAPPLVAVSLPCLVQSTQHPQQWQRLPRPQNSSAMSSWWSGAECAFQQPAFLRTTQATTLSIDQVRIRIHGRYLFLWSVSGHSQAAPTKTPPFGKNPQSPQYLVSLFVTLQAKQGRLALQEAVFDGVALPSRLP